MGVEDNFMNRWRRYALYSASTKEYDFGNIIQICGWIATTHVIIRRIYLAIPLCIINNEH